MARKKKPAGVRRRGHHVHPANECGVCAHPREDRIKFKEQLPSIDEIPVLGEDEEEK